MPVQTNKKPRLRETELGVADLPYTVVTLLLTAVGLIMLFSASYADAFLSGNDSAGYLKSQFVFAIGGVAAFFFLSRIRYDLYRRAALPIYCVTVILLLLVLVMGVEVNGAKRWINIGFQFQPSEVAKLALVIMLARVLSQWQKEVRSGKVVVLCAGVVLGIVGLVLLEKHASATIILLAVSFLMMAVGGVNRKFLLGLVLVGVVGMTVLLLFGGYTSARIQAWLHPEDYPQGSAYQVLQSLYAIGSGGLTGLGFGKGRQKYGYLPEVQNDYVFSVVCEELGFVGVVGILFLFAMLVIRGFWIAIHARDRFSMLLATGLTARLALQVILNVAVITNLLPPTGISLPFFSSGGTALIMLLAECGIVLNISRSIDSK